MTDSSIENEGFTWEQWCKVTPLKTLEAIQESNRKLLGLDKDVNMIPKWKYEEEKA